MKFSMQNFLSVLLFTAVLLPLFSGEKATIHYKNGSTLDCVIENYEIGKYAEVIDEKGNKRIISWDNISEVVFIKEEVILEPVEEIPVMPPVPAAAVPVPAAESQSQSSTGSKSMMDQFKEKDKKTEETRPKNAAERWAEKNNQEASTTQITQETLPDVDYDRKSGKVSVEYYKTLESDSKRRSWIENGGVLFTKGATVNYSYITKDMSEEVPGGESDFSMHGFGYTGSMYYKFLDPPNYDNNKTNWNSPSIGFNGSFNLNFGNMEYTASGYNMTMEMTMGSFEISVPCGYTFGLGRFLTPEDWKGVMIGLFWKPTFQMTSVTTTMDMDPDPFGFYPITGDPTNETSMNFGGIQWTLDWGSFGALSESLAKEAHFSISAFILPETGTTPLIFNIGLGMVWY